MNAGSATSPQITVLLAIAALAAIWMFLWKTKTERRATRLIDWVWRNHPEAWSALPWIYRNLLRERGLGELARRRVISDPHFTSEYETIAPLRRHIVIAGAIAGGAILLIAIGARYFGWQF
ncbi:MAG: hypothetical protein JSU82_08510 [Rhodospirillales bacterium]|nr:MAG: hypothetical protein JSU82_08510 [Rhodospirillales bacterium]